MERTLVRAAVLALLAGGAGVCVAAGPGPNGSNTYGLCTAYFAGSETGQADKRKAPPLQVLEAAAEAEDMTVGEYCARYGQEPGGGKGKQG